MYSDRIAWFAHNTKRGKETNWQGTSSGAEGDLLSEILGKVKKQGYSINQLVMDPDTSANAIVCSYFRMFTSPTVVTTLLYAVSIGEQSTGIFAGRGLVSYYPVVYVVCD